MTDIVERLRQGRTDGTELRWTVTDIHREAADEIERLRAKLEAVEMELASVTAQITGLEYRGG